MATRPTFCITTAIPYANGKPHIGHAYERIATDAIARFQRLDGRDFPAAGRLTRADISVGYPLNNLGRPHFAGLLGPRAQAYRERLVARPAFQRAAAIP